MSRSAGGASAEGQLRVVGGTNWRSLADRIDHQPRRLAAGTGLDMYSSSTHELMSQRLELLRQLADSLEQAQSSLATATPAKLDLHTARQQELCRELRAHSVTDFAKGTAVAGRLAGWQTICKWQPGRWRI